MFVCVYMCTVCGVFMQCVWKGVYSIVRMYICVEPVTLHFHMSDMSIFVCVCT